MLNIFSNDSISKQIEQIDNVDFGQLYDSMKLVHDFLDEKIRESGSEAKALDSLDKKFKDYILYKDYHIELRLVEVNIDGNGKKSANLEIVMLNKEKNGDLEEFGNYYFRYDIEEYETRDKINIDFQIIPIKNIIKKKLNLIKQYLLFKNDESYLTVSIPPLIKFRLYKKLDVSGVSLYAGEEKTKKKLSIIKKYLNRELETIGTIKESRSIADIYEIQTSKGRFDIIYKEEPTTVDTRSVANHGYLTRGIYIQFRSIEKEKADEISTEIEEIIKKIETMLEEKDRVMKITKTTIKNLIVVLSSYDKQRSFMIDRTETLLKEYKLLIEKGETYYAPMVVSLLTIVLDDLEGGKRENISSNAGIKIDSYLEFGTYNDLLDAIVLDVFHPIKKYLKHRMVTIYKDNQQLDKKLEILSSICNYTDETLFHIFDYVIIKGYGDRITAQHINNFLNLIPKGGETILMDNIVTKLIKYNPLTHNLGRIEGLDIYSQLQDFPLSKLLQEEVEDMLVIVVSLLLLKNPKLVNKSHAEIAKTSGLDRYITDIPAFFNKYESRISRKFQSYLISNETEIIGTRDIDFSLYNNLNSDHISYFIDNILFPDIFWKLHRNGDAVMYDKVEETLKRGHLLRLLSDLDYPSEIIGIISKQTQGEKEGEKLCAKILGHWEYLHEVEIDDYTSKGLTDLINKVVMPNHEEMEEKDYLRLLSMSTELTEDMQEKMVNFRSSKVRLQLAMRQELTIKIQDMLADNSKESIKIAYLETEREERSSGALEIIAENSDEEACLILVKKFSSLEEGIQYNLVSHRSTKVKIELAKRKDLTERIQEKLAEDSKENVKIVYLETERTERNSRALEIIAENSDKETCLIMLKRFPILAEDIQENLASHRSPMVREKLARREDLTEGIQKKIAEDSKESVKIAYLETKREKRNSRALEMIAENSDKEACLILLRNFPSLTEDAQENLADHRSEDVRIQLAKREDLTERIQEKIAEDSKESVKIAYLEIERKERNLRALETIAYNSEKETCLILLRKFPILTGDIQNNLANHRSEEVRIELAKREDLTERIQEKIADDNKEDVIIAYLEAKRYDWSEKAISIISHSGSKEACLFLLERPGLSDMLLGNLRDHRSEEVRTIATERLLS